MQLAYGAALAMARQEGEVVLRSAASALLAAEDVEGAAKAERILAELLWSQGRVPESIDRLRTAMDLLAHRPASPEKAEMLLAYWRFRWLAGLEPSDAVLDEALAVAERLGRKDLIVSVRLNLALRHGFSGGDRRAIAEHEEAIQLAREIGTPEILRGYINLASLHHWMGDRKTGDALHQEGRALAERFGDVIRARFLDGELLLDQLTGGDWDASLANALAFIDECKLSPHYLESGAQQAVISILLARDDVEGARPHVDRLRALAEEIQDPQVTIPAYAMCARFAAETGDAAGARRALAALPAPSSGTPTLMDPAWVKAALAAADVGAPELIASSLVSANDETAWARAVQAMRDGHMAAAAEACAGAGDPFCAALLTLRAVEGGEEVAATQVADAVAFFRRVGAARYLRRMDPWLSGASLQRR
jgi:hypothetical protein